MKLFLRTIISVAVLFIIPQIVFAQTVFSILDSLTNFFADITTIAFMLIFVVFFFGIGTFIKKSGGEAKDLAEWKMWLFWSVIAVFVALTFWGILGFIQNTTYIDSIIIPPQR